MVGKCEGPHCMAVGEAQQKPKQSRLGGEEGLRRTGREWPCCESRMGETGTRQAARAEEYRCEGHRGWHEGGCTVGGTAEPLAWGQSAHQIRMRYDTRMGKVVAGGHGGRGRMSWRVTVEGEWRAGVGLGWVCLGHTCPGERPRSGPGGLHVSGRVSAAPGGRGGTLHGGG